MEYASYSAGATWHQMSTQHIPVYLGEQIQDRNELRFLERLRADLSSRSIGATIYANFIADPRRNARQIDFLVLSAHRLVHVELKTVSRDSQVHAAANGPWRQILPGGQIRTWKNAYRQAHGATYAISDDVERLTNQGLLPKLVGRFFRYIDTVVCFFPDIPPASQVEPYRYVTACGYESLLQRLSRPGPYPSKWTTDDAQTFARELNLYAEPSDAEAHARRTADLNTLAAYHSRYVQARSANLHELVSVGAVDGDNNQHTAPLDTILGAIRDADALTFTGPSGSGKSHTVDHAVLHAARGAALPIWVQCGDYEGDTFTVATAKAAARFTTEPWNTLLERAVRNGITPVIVLDGLNECSPSQQRVLLEGASAYRLATGCSLIVTAQEPVPLPAARSLHTQLPSPDERNDLLLSYGVPTLPNADAFRTPWELAMAADCANDLGDDAGPVDVFDLYVRRRTDSERQRDQIRALAIAMQRRLQLSLAIAQTRTIVSEHSDRPPTADEFDRLLSSPLLTVGPRRLSFAHESLGQFLAAEHVVLNSINGTQLAEVLAEPALAGLREIAIEVERDTDRQAAALTQLADPALIAAAARGQYGPATEAHVHAAMRQALERAATLTAQAQFTYTDDLEKPASPMPGHWSLPEPLSRTDSALMTGCGLCLHDGVLLVEVVQLLDATDEHCATAMRDLRQRGVRTAISAIVAATFYPGLVTEHRTDLPATIVLRSCESDRFRASGSDGDAARGSHVRHATAQPARWGRTLAALLVLNPDSAEDLALTLQLIDEAWQLGGYHLRLQVLERARAAAWRMDKKAQDELRTVLESFDVQGNWAFSSLLVEALAACGGIEPLTTTDAIREEIARVLEHPSDPDACTLARSILGKLFEDESIFGPYSEVISDLEPSDLIALCGMALRDDDPSISIIRDWAVERIADHIDQAGPELRRTIENIAAAPPAHTFMAYEGLKAHVEALRGWAKVADRLPDSAPAPGDLVAQTWRLIDELVFPQLRGVPLPPKQAESIWEQLSGHCKPAAVDGLLQLCSMTVWTGETRTSIYQQLDRAYPERLRTLYEWGLENWPDVRPATGTHLLTSRDSLVHELGQLGNADTQALLHRHIDDPDLSPVVIEAIRAVERRNT